jgi:hypothetical protein
MVYNTQKYWVSWAFCKWEDTAFRNTQNYWVSWAFYKSEDTAFRNTQNYWGSGHSANQKTRRFWTLRTIGFLGILQIRTHGVSEHSELLRFLGILQIRRHSFSEHSELLRFLGILQVKRHSFSETGCFRNVVFSSYIEYQTMDKIQEPSDCEKVWSIFSPLLPSSVTTKSMGVDTRSLLAVTQVNINID